MRRLLTATLALSLLAGAGAASAQSAPDANYKPPRTTWGVPALDGVWTNASLTALQKIPSASAVTITEEERERLLAKNRYTLARADEAGVSKLDKESSDKLLADKNPSRGYNTFWMDPGANYAKVKGEYRSSWITYPADGRIPYTEAGIAANTRATHFDDYEIRPLAERCLMSFTGGAGPVMNNGMYNNTYQIVQSPGSVMILTEMIHDVRVIPIVASAAEAKHGPAEIPKWGGDAVGWYEGDTLVVQTVNSHPKQRSFIGPGGKVTERYSRWSDGQILYEFRVEDPKLYKEAWGGEMSLNHSSEPLYEYACHEGNYALEGILAGARKLEREGRPHPIEKPIFAGVDIPDGE